MSECLKASPEFERLVRDFEALVLPGRPIAGWPPATPLKKWGKDASGSIAFSRECALELLRTIEQARIPRGQAVISNLGSGLATLFWGQIFNRVLAVTGTPLPDGMRILQIPPDYNGTTVLTPDLVAKAKAADYRLWIWPNGGAYENADGYARLFAMGVDGVNASKPAAGVAAKLAG